MIISYLILFKMVAAQDNDQNRVESASVQLLSCVLPVQHSSGQQQRRRRLSRRFWLKSSRT